MSPRSVVPVQAMLRPKGAPAPCPELIRPIENVSWKPYGGLWTSTFDPTAGTTGWSEWGTDSQFLTGEHQFWLFDVHPAGRVVEVNSHDGLLALYGEFSYTAWDGKPRVDYEAAAAAGVDAIRLTEAGLEELRDSDDFMFAADYSCESTVWFRWAFTAVTPGPVVACGQLAHV